MGRNLLLVAGAGALAVIAWALLAGAPVDNDDALLPAIQDSSGTVASKDASDPAVDAATIPVASSSPNGQSISAELAHFNQWQSPDAAQARQRIAARGATVLPEVIAALRATSDAAARIDLTDPGRDRAATEAILMRQNHLLGTVAAIGGDAATDAVLDTSGRMRADNPLRGSIYAALDAMGDAAAADQHAIDVIANPGSRSIELATALARFWLATPPEAGRSLAEHYDSDSPQSRALALKLAVNLGRADEVRAPLVSAVKQMQYAQPGNKQLLLALADIEPRAQFLARLDGLRLRPTVRETAQTYSDFLAADEAARETMLAGMLRSSDSELWAQAVQYMVEARRLDLLAKHQLIYVPSDPVAAYDKHVSGFSRMTRDQRLRYLDAAEVDRIEHAAASVPAIGFGPGVEKVLRQLGYTATRSGFEISLSKQSR